MAVIRNHTKDDEDLRDAEGVCSYLAHETITISDVTAVADFIRNHVV